jgi:hypothetical protein
LLYITFCSISYTQLCVGVHGGGNFANSQCKFLIPTYNTANEFIEYKLSKEFTGKTKNNFTVGALVEAKLYSFLFLQSEVNYIERRITMEASELNNIVLYGANWPMDISLKYIDIPVLIKLKQKYNSFLPYIFGGINIGLLQKKHDYKNIKHFYSVAEYTKETQSYTLFGLGTDYILNKKTNLFITLRYSNSLVDIETSENRELKPYNYDVLIGIKTKIWDY